MNATTEDMNIPATSEQQQETSASGGDGPISPFPPSTTDPEEFYTHEDLKVYNLLSTPIYIFDIKNKCMYWANHEGVKLWNAPSLESLLSRDFASDMSAASERRMTDYLRKFRRGERVRERWTMYPDGKKVNVNECCSGIHIGPDGHMAILCESIPVDIKDEVDKASLRGVEMLRHLPVAVSQFDMGGTLMYQNPEALDLFGGLEDDDDEGPSPTESGGGKSKSKDENDDDENDTVDDEAANKPRESQSSFISRFEDTKLGQSVLQQVQSGNDYTIETQQHTRKGPSWFAITVRKSIDPVTEEPILLYSARDIAAVIRAKNEADQANMEKSEMLAVLAHEIRTPLHQVVGFIDMLGGTELNQEQNDYVKSLQTATLSLMTIINDILDFTKLEAGKMEMETIAFDPKAVCEGCLEVVRPVAEKNGLRVIGQCLGSIPDGLVVMGDPNRIRQVILNLLSNAAKFTHQGSITLTHTALPVDSDRYMLRWVVADTGIGIPHEHLEVIFNKYRQQEAATSRHYGGTGLGLAICKILSEVMGGTISVKSEYRVGSAFTFEVPVSVEQKDNHMRKLRKLNSQLPFEGTDKFRLLVAEDNKMNQKLIRAMLKRAGHEATIVENGQLAVETVEATKGDFDLVLMDVQMPVLDGVDATKQIRSMGYSKKKLPIVGLTASFQTSELQNYLEIGMNDCVGKPIRIGKIQEMLRELKARA